MEDLVLLHCMRMLWKYLKVQGRHGAAYQCNNAVKSSLQGCSVLVVSAFWFLLRYQCGLCLSVLWIITFLILVLEVSAAWFLWMDELLLFHGEQRNAIMSPWVLCTWGECSVIALNGSAACAQQYWINVQNHNTGNAFFIVSFLCVNSYFYW